MMNEWGCRWVVIDVETTGLDPDKHGILEIAAKTDEGDVFELACCPQGCEWELEALCVNGRLVPQIEDEKQPSPRMATVRLLEFLMKRNPTGRWTVVGRNPRFDLGFLRKASGLANRVLDKEPVDLHDLVRARLVAKGIRPGRFTTNERYALLGFPPEPLPHTALQGVEAAWAAYQELSGNTAAASMEAER